MIQFFLIDRKNKSRYVTSSGNHRQFRFRSVGFQFLNTVFMFFSDSFTFLGCNGSSIFDAMTGVTFAFKT